jgi:hypothetical protein
VQDRPTEDPTREQRPRIDISTLCNGREPTAAATRLLQFAGRIVALGNLLPDHERHGSTIPCRCRPRGRPCPGRLEILRPAQTDHVSWRCQVCGDGGCVTGWRGTRWDLTPQLQSGHVVSLFAARSRQQDQADRGTVRVVRLAVELVGGPVRMIEPVRRQLAIPLDASLHALHELLRCAFGWHDDGPYDFLLGAPYEPGSQRFTGWQRDPAADPAGASVNETELIALDSLALRVGQVFGYLFDFADEWIHRLEVLAFEERGPAAARARVEKRAGKAPPQHPDGRPAMLRDLSCGAIETSAALDQLCSYDPERPLPAHQWLALDPAEQLLRVLAAHRASACGDQEASLLLHAALHCLAETSLAQGDRASRTALRRQLERGGSRHDVIHRLGELLAGTTARAPGTRNGDPCRDGDACRTATGRPAAAPHPTRNNPPPETRLGRKQAL